MAGGSALALPMLLGLFSINLILVRLADLRRNLPYAQVGQFYLALYVLSVLLLLMGSARVAMQFATFWWVTRRR